MDNNRDRRTDGNDILKEALESNKNDREFFDFENETIVFRKAYKQGNNAPKDDKSEMQHTAQIKGGAVVRPLKQTVTPPPVKTPPVKKAEPAANKNPQAAPKSSTVNHSPITPQAGTPRPVVSQPVKPQTTAAQYSASQTGAKQQQNRRIVPSEGRNVPVNKPVQQPKPQQAAVQPKPAPTSTPTSASASAHTPTPAKSNSVIASKGEGRSTVKNTVNGRVIQPQVTESSKTNASSRAVRSENDDFEIDEATYTGGIGKRGKNEYGGVGESASGAIMSLVKAMVYIVAIIAVSVGLSVFVIDTANDIFKLVVDDKIVSVSIPENATIDDVADALYDSGAIKHKWAFKLWSNLKDAEAKFVPGDYEVSTTLNYDYLRGAFKESNVKTEVRITIPEGYTVDEIIDLFLENGIGTREGFVDVINNYDFDYPFLDGLITREGRIYRLEGYLFPDTYYFYDDSSEVTVIKKLLDNFNRKFVDEYYVRCAELGLSVDDAIILASMVEKETRYADELGYVSSVFHNRIKYSASFPYLNSDATIMYAMAHDLGGRPDTMVGEDTEYDSPYNTYTYKGLPPGPIANPGLNSIKYALYPNESDYFYFVSDSSGRTLFATTEPEHLANVAAVRGK